MPFGPMELGIILLMVVIIFGAGKLPEIGGALGRGIKEFKDATDEDAPVTAGPARSGDARPQVFEAREMRADEI